MTRLQQFLQRACRESDLEIIFPFRLSLKQGAEIDAQALIPQLGADKGMIVVSWSDELKGAEGDLREAGYGFSVISDVPASEEFDLVSYRDMFCDWGWSGLSGKKPKWMNR